MKPIDISPLDLETVRRILREHVPEMEVRAFGSRVSWTARESSDLDLALMSCTPLNSKLVANLRLAFSNSSLPFRVDIVDWASTSREFKRIVEQESITICDRKHDSGTAFTEALSPQIPAHWNRMKLHSLATWFKGPSSKHVRFSKDGQPLIGISEIKNGLSDQTRYTQQIFDESVRLRSGDLLLAWLGQPPTCIDAFRWSGPDGWTSQDIVRVVPASGTDDTFLYYLLKYLSPNLGSIALNKLELGFEHMIDQDLNEIEVAIPELCEQRMISNVLRTLDNKIELNRRTGKTIELIARAIFESWFVDLDPMIVKDYAQIMSELEHAVEPLSDELVRSELGELPNGWKVQSLGNLLEFFCVDDLGGSDGHSQCSISGSDPLRHLQLQDNGSIKGPSIVVSQEGNLGSVTWVQSDFVPMDIDFFALPKNGGEHLPFLYYALCHQHLPFVSDAATPILNRDLAYKGIQITPPEDLIIEFNRHFRPIFALIHCLNLESNTLTSLSKLLLKGLFSGEISCPKTVNQDTD